MLRKLEKRMISIDDSEFKLPLRHWLKKQVDSEKYYGLEWVKEDGQQFIKIPWIQQHHPDWERSYELFVSWAKHKNHYKDPPNYKKLKGNFRCAMRKCPDFKEVEAVQNQQSGNYKLYKLLDPEEVNKLKQKKRPESFISSIWPSGKHKRKRSGEDKLHSGETCNGKIKQEVLSPQRNFPSSEDSSPAPGSSFTPDPDVYLSPADTIFTSSVSSYQTSPSVSSPPGQETQLDIHPPDDIDGIFESFSPIETSVPVGVDSGEDKTPSFQEYFEKFVEDANKFDNSRCSALGASNLNMNGVALCAMSPGPYHFDAPSPNYNNHSAQQLLHSGHNSPPPAYTAASSPLYLNRNGLYGEAGATLSTEKEKKVIEMLPIQIDSGVLSCFTMRVYYTGEVRHVLEFELNFSANRAGYRLCYGDVKRQESVYREHQRHEMLALRPVPMPKYRGTNGNVHEILKKFQQGVALKYDAQLARLTCTRHSQSAVFFCGSDVVGLDRNTPHEVFAHEPMVRKYRQRNKANHMQTELVIGTKPHRAKLVKIKLRPLLAHSLTPLPIHAPLMESIAPDSSSLQVVHQPDTLDLKMGSLSLNN